MAITATVTRGFTFATGVDVTAASLNQLGEPTVAISEGNVNITGGTISGLSHPLPLQMEAQEVQMQGQQGLHLDLAQLPPKQAMQLL